MMLAQQGILGYVGNPFSLRVRVKPSKSLDGLLATSKTKQSGLHDMWLQLAIVIGKTCVLLQPSVSPSQSQSDIALLQKEVDKFNGRVNPQDSRMDIIQSNMTGQHQEVMLALRSLGA